MKLELDESRRLTGPNLLWDQPGAIIDVFTQDVDKAKVADTWQSWARKLMDGIGWTQEKTICRECQDGLNMALSAPMDALYTACMLADVAWEYTVAELSQQATPNWEESIQNLSEELDKEVNPRLIDIMLEAEKHEVTCISDDDHVSLGMGESVDTWEIRHEPNLQDINWSKYSDIPIALITGTNGKSTSVRLASEIAKAAGKVAGVTSTDFIRVGEDILDTGDYSGPGGARILIRDKRTQMAFLEVARGGILRRGLPIKHAQVALVTNIAEDHLGQYGIDTVEELADAKLVVAKALDDSGMLILNADNAFLRDKGPSTGKQICWFSEDRNHPLILDNIKSGIPAAYLVDEVITYFDGSSEHSLAHTTDLPMSFDGKARHNIQNALAVCALSFGLGIPEQAIVHGLTHFGSNAKDNPGRSNQYQVAGSRVIVDFAHNEHSVRAVINMVKQLPARRKIVMFSHAGDRSDAQIENLTSAVADLKADLYITAEVEQYLRGREPGEVPDMSKRFLLDRGISENRIMNAESPLAGTALALQEAVEDSVIVLFTLDQREHVQHYIQERQ